MAKHKIEFDAKCESCNGSGLYVGMAEKDGAAIVCVSCKGTGKVHEVITYEDFEKKKKRRGVKRVFKCNCGIGIGAGKTDKHGQISLEDFGGMPYKDWFAGKKFPPKSEMRKFSCPVWYYQSADYDKKPHWKECGFGSFRDCKYFSTKEKCWDRFDLEGE